MMAIQAVVKNGLIKPLETIGLPEDKEIVIYISDEKVEEYSEWSDEEWQMMKHQEENKYFGKYLCQVTGDINKHYGRGVKNVIYDID